MRKVLRVMLWVFAVVMVLLAVAAVLVTNPNYHLTTDTAETLDYERMAHVVTGVYAAVTGL